MIHEARPDHDLSGTSVLVIEDEFYLAMEMKEQIERAGGTVLGPCPDVPSGLWELALTRPDCAIVDINLGWGPSFAVPEELQRRGLPFLFLTGYDAPTIPAGLKDVERMEKPADLDRVMKAITRLAGK